MRNSREAPRRPQVVIIGGGFGGLQTALSLSTCDVDVTLVDRRNHHLFQPLLYQVATAGLAVSDIAMPLRAVLRRAKNVRVVLAEVDDVDTAARRVVLRDAPDLQYDFVVVAAGADTRYPGGGHAGKVLGLKNLDDARTIRQRVLTCLEAAELERNPARRRALTTFVVVGGGPTGVEMAGALRELANASAGLGRGYASRDEVRVLLVEQGDRVLSSFTQKLSASARAQLEGLGVEVRTDSSLRFVGPGRVEVDEEALDVGAIIWAAGVAPVPLAEKVAPVAADGRIRVEQDCSLSGSPEVFAIGDIARFVPDGSDEPLPGLAPVAMQQGQHVARQIARTVAGKPRQPFRYTDRGAMATIGRSRAVAQSGRLALTGHLAWLAWLVVHLATLVGFRNRMAVFVNWMWHYFTFRQGHRILLPAAGELDRPVPQPSAPSAEASEGACSSMKGAVLG